MLEVDFVAEQGVALGGRAQRVERRGDDGRGCLLVVEDCDGADGHEEDEDGKGAAPAVGNFADVWIAIASVYRANFFSLSSCSILFAN